MAGRTFEARYAPHGDHHDLWIAPDDADRLIIADDGGAQVSYDAGESWSTYMNQPTAQFYRVTTDDAFPYRIYGAQQDNSAMRIDSRSRGRVHHRRQLGEHGGRRECSPGARSQRQRHRLWRKLRRASDAV